MHSAAIKKRTFGNVEHSWKLKLFLIRFHNSKTKKISWDKRVNLLRDGIDSNVDIWQFMRSVAMLPFLSRNGGHWMESLLRKCCPLSLRWPQESWQKTHNWGQSWQAKKIDWCIFTPQDHLSGVSFIEKVSFLAMSRKEPNLWFLWLTKHKRRLKFQPNNTSHKIRRFSPNWNWEKLAEGNIETFSHTLLLENPLLLVVKRGKSL